MYAFVFRFNGFNLRLSVKGKRANHNRPAWRVNSWSKSKAGRPTYLAPEGIKLRGQNYEKLHIRPVKFKAIE
jgi:hypothetical protein